MKKTRALSSIMNKEIYPKSKRSTRVCTRFGFEASSCKRSQLKIQQMAFMLMAITLFFALVGLFVLAFKSSGIKKEAMILEEENAIGLAEKLSNSPEFSCGNSFGTSRINCIDEDKLMALKENINNFEELWGIGITNIKIIKIYPEEETKECNIENYPNCNKIVLKESSEGFSASSIISLCRKEAFEGESYDKCDIARLLINYKDWRENE